MRSISCIRSVGDSPIAGFCFFIQKAPLLHNSDNLDALCQFSPLSLSGSRRFFFRNMRLNNGFSTSYYSCHKSTLKVPKTLKYIKNTCQTIENVKYLHNRATILYSAFTERCIFIIAFERAILRHIKVLLRRRSMRNMLILCHMMIMQISPQILDDTR